MAEATDKTQCIICNKIKATLRCGGCLREYCHKHLETHRQELNHQLDEIEINHDLIRQSLLEHIEQPNKQLLIEQIDAWEQKSIKTIQQTATDVRQTVLRNTSEYSEQLAINLNKLKDQLKESRDEDNFNEIDLRLFRRELDKLTSELNKPSNISIREDPATLIHKISVDVSTTHLTSTSDEFTLTSDIHQNTKWLQNGVTVAGGNGSGNALNQLSCPCGIYVDDDRFIYVADSLNHRIIGWKNGAIDGQVLAGGNGEGNELNQLNKPTDVCIDKQRNYLIICDQGNRRLVQWPCQGATLGQIIISNIDCQGVAMDKDGYVYVSDRKNDEVRRWKLGDTDGTLVAGGNGRGNDLNQLNYPTYIYVDENRSIYVSDRANHRVMKWLEGAKEGLVVAGNEGEGNSLVQLACPEGVIADHLGTVYVADYNNHRIVACSNKTEERDIIAGGYGQGEQAKQFNYPIGLSLDRHRSLYVSDWNNHRIQRFDLDAS